MLPAADPKTASGLRLQVEGVLLFLFIPVVLFLYVAHPEPVGASLVAGLVLMVGHRSLARPYMARARPVKCVWCNRALPPAGTPAAQAETATLALSTGAGPIEARACRGHREPAARFFAFVEGWRWPLRLGIFLPLVFLLVALAFAAVGRDAPVPLATDVFRLAVGVTVNLAAFGYLFAASAPREPVAVPFPAHNFFLLGVRALAWIFRLVGIWWIVAGLRGLILR